MDKILKKGDDLLRQMIQIRTLVGAVVHLNEPFIHGGRQTRRDDLGCLQRPHKGTGPDRGEGNAPQLFRRLPRLGDACFVQRMIASTLEHAAAVQLRLSVPDDIDHVLASFRASKHRIGPDKLLRRRAAFQVAQQNLGAGVTVAVGPVVVEVDVVKLAHVVELVADPRKQVPAHDHGAKALDGGLPRNVVRLQAVAQNADIKARVVRDKNARGHERLDPLPENGKGGRAGDGLGADAGELGVEPVEGLLRIDQREKLVRDPSVLNNADADGAHAVVIAVWGLHVKNDVSHFSVPARIVFQ